MDGLKNQETFQQTGTWLGQVGFPGTQSSSLVRNNPEGAPPVLFFPDWEMLPSDCKLPHADIISERLETLVTLEKFREASPGGLRAPIMVTSCIALMQPTFPSGVLGSRTRTLQRGCSKIPWTGSSGSRIKVTNRKLR